MADLDQLHPLLRRQWHRYFGREHGVAEAWQPFLHAVSQAYVEGDTARRMVERALALSSAELHATNAELRGVLQALPDLLFRVTADGQMRGVMQGSSVSAHPALRAFDLQRPGAAGTTAAEFWSAVAQVRERQTPVLFEYAQETPEELRYFEVRLLPFVNGDIVGIVRDISERTRAETALRESEERLALAQRAGHVGAFDWDVQTGRIFWSAESEATFGLARDRFEGNHAAWMQRVSPEDRGRLEEFFRDWFRSAREEEQWEYRIVCPDGRERYVESKGRVYRDGDGAAVRVIGTHLDITARKQAEQDRLVLGKLESTGILAGGIAHDFNNLLTSILLNLELARLPGVPSEEIADYMAQARRSVMGAQVLTQQLITFARGGAVARRPTHLGELLQESVSLPLSGSNVRAEVTIASELWAANVDAGQIGQVVRNLLLNAREAMPAGGVVSLRADNVRLGPGNAPALPVGAYVRVSVTDSGHGIAADVLPKIFDPYFSTKTRGEQKGMGLGLTICHSIMQKHAGAITVESTPGAGTQFTVYLPACEREIARPAPAAAAPVRVAPRAPGRILVMDDEPMVRTVFQQVLARLGYEAVLVENGQAALDRYAEAQCEGRPFAVVFLDLTVKGEMGGGEAARELQARDPDVRSVVMSGYSDDDLMRQYQQYGFKAALAKPFDYAAVRDVLNRVLRHP